VWVVFNGEIYNFKQLRSVLQGKGHRFSSSSDTEVIVHLYEEYGEHCVSKLQGMFSFALWDEKNRSLLLARDRVGIKPLYYHVSSDGLLFGSEIKAILADPDVVSEPDLPALDHFLSISYLPGEETLFKNVRKLKPGHYMTARDGVVKATQYWDLSFSESRADQPVEDTIEELRTLLSQTVRDHLISDVPVGILLSGGVDSTALLSYAVEEAGNRLSTFTIGFDERLCSDERTCARLLAASFGTSHHEMTISAQDFVNWLPGYIWHMEEPVCEPPAIALYYITKLARQHVTVLLSGEGGDEAFAGYNNYRNLLWLEAVKNKLGSFAKPVSRMCDLLGRCFRVDRMRYYAQLLGMPVEEYYFSRASSPYDLFNDKVSEFYSHDLLRCRQQNGPALLFDPLFAVVGGRDPLQKMLYVDTKTWLPDDLLVKADKMTMANSVELRVPFLDHRVLEFAASLPASLKVHGFQTKYALKRAIATRVPREILNRPKTGFPVPYHRWLRSELREFVRDLLTGPRAVSRGYFRQDAIEALLNQNAKYAKYSKEVFSLVLLELWHRAFVDQRIETTAMPRPVRASYQGCGLFENMTTS
jgi:asparagine synthase (glutamine-hydrolysing)